MVGTGLCIERSELPVDRVECKGRHFINRQLEATEHSLDKTVIRDEGSRIILYFKSNRI